MHPYLLRIGSFELRIYSLMLIIAVIISLYFIGRRAKRLNMDSKMIENAVLIIFFGGVLGARLYYVVFNWSYFSQNPGEILAVWHGGLAIHGGIIAGIITAFIWCRCKKISIFFMGDLLAPFLLFGQGIGRFGNFANGEAHGVPTITPPEIIFQFKPIFSQFWNSVLTQENVPNTPEQPRMTIRKIPDGMVAKSKIFVNSFIV